MIPTEKLLARLEKLDCPPSQIRQVADKIQALPEDIYAAFEAWFATGELPDIQVEGQTVGGILKNHPERTVVGAFLALEWLRREPARAKALLAKPAFLSARDIQTLRR